MMLLVGVWLVGLVVWLYVVITQTSAWSIVGCVFFYAAGVVTVGQFLRARSSRFPTVWEPRHVESVDPATRALIADVMNTGLPGYVQWNQDGTWEIKRVEIDDA